MEHSESVRAPQRGTQLSCSVACSRPQSTAVRKVLPNQPEPFHNMEFFRDLYYDELSSGKVKQIWVDNPKSPLQNFVMIRFGRAPKYQEEEGFVGGRRESSVR